ncbi:MAG: carboxypeptidase-like regulatory domain-containing protein [Bryobacteraceae bacterium]
MRGTIPNPCSRLWADLPGDARRRFCSECGRDIHAVAAYTDSKWDALMAQGSVCAYSERESATAPRSRRAVLAAALLTTISPLLAQSGRLRFSVTDASEAIVVNAEVSISCADGKRRTARTDAGGFAIFADLPFGDCQLSVASAGFQTARGTYTVKGSDETRVPVRLTVGKIVMGLYVTDSRPKSVLVRFKNWLTSCTRR